MQSLVNTHPRLQHPSSPSPPHSPSHPHLLDDGFVVIRQFKDNVFEIALRSYGNVILKILPLKPSTCDKLAFLPKVEGMIPLFDRDMVYNELTAANLASNAQIGPRVLSSGILHAVATATESNVDDKRGYIIMEKVNGLELGNYVMQKPLSQVVFIKILEAFATLKTLGYIHGDPATNNIMIGLNDNVRLIDFGCARKPGLEETTIADSSDPYRDFGTFVYWLSSNYRYTHWHKHKTNSGWFETFEPYIQTAKAWLHQRYPEAKHTYFAGCLKMIDNVRA